MTGGRFSENYTGGGGDIPEIEKINLFTLIINVDYGNNYYKSSFFIWLPSIFFIFLECLIRCNFLCSTQKLSNSIFLRACFWTSKLFHMEIFTA